ncbi:MAG: pilus assembly protein TadG-related protein [Actinomycetota bacterium]
MSIVVAASATIALIASLGVADVGKALVARARARAAADAAALAAAQEMALPSGRAPVDLARDYADRNGGALTTCECAQGTLSAVVEVTVPLGDLFLASDGLIVNARARAIVEGGP